MRILLGILCVALVGCRFEVPTEVSKNVPTDAPAALARRLPARERIFFEKLLGWLQGDSTEVVTSAQLEQFSFTIWMKASGSNDYYYRLAEKGGYATGKGFGIEYRVPEQPNAVQCLIWDSKSQAPVRVMSKTSTALADGDWHHVACIYDGQNVLLYVDGRFQRQAEATYYDNEAPVTIGKQAGAEDKFFPGELSSASLYNYAISEGEIDRAVSEGL